MKQYSESCEQNREPIFSVIAPLLVGCSHLLEIGSGTGQHAVYFAGGLPHLVWQSSDRLENHPSIQIWIDEYRLDNTPPPLELDVCQPQWPQLTVDTIFSANTTHIMSWPMVERMFAGVGGLLSSGGDFLLYGPFNYHGCYTSESNHRFDQWLKQRDPLSGVRDFEAVDRLASQAGMELVSDYPMPANNRTLHWRKR